MFHVEHFTIKMPIKTVSTLNCREHWVVRHRRGAKQKRDTLICCTAAYPQGIDLEGRKATIRLTRIGVRKMDSDNLAGACKAVRDGIAIWLGINDGHDSLTWLYDQIIDRGNANNLIAEISVGDYSSR